MGCVILLDRAGTTIQLDMSFGKVEHGFEGCAYCLQIGMKWQSDE